MNRHHPPLYGKTDPKAQRKRALANVYNLLMKLAKEKETAGAKKKEPAHLKSNIPPRQV